ncbi:hypothetical protein [Mesorhizobium sp. f-mel]
MSKATIQSLPFEIKLTVGVWFVSLLYSMALGIWLATVGFPKVPEFVIVPVMIVFALSWLVFVQLCCYRAFGFGVLETFGNMLDPAEKCRAE